MDGAEPRLIQIFLSREVCDIKLNRVLINIKVRNWSQVLKRLLERALLHAYVLFGYGCAGLVHDFKAAVVEVVAAVDCYGLVIVEAVETVTALANSLNRFDVVGPRWVETVVIGLSALVELNVLLVDRALVLVVV